MELVEMKWGVLDCIHLDQDKDKWRPVVNTVMNYRDSQNREENFLTRSVTIRF